MPSLWDETNKALIENKTLGVKLPHNNTAIPCLLWMDDVVLAETNHKMSQKQLDITYDISQKYHVEYGMNKTKFLRIGNAKEPMKLKLGKKRLMKQINTHIWVK